MIGPFPYQSIIRLLSLDTLSVCRYYIVVWRRTAFYMVNYILPAFLINVISLFVFMMPSESGEKITLGISAMLNM